MLTAIHKETGKVLYGPELSEEEGSELKGLIVDPIFRQPCLYVNRSIDGRCSHFRMMHSISRVDYEKDFLHDDEYFVAHGKTGEVYVRESREHLLGKEKARNVLVEELGYNKEDAILEHRIRMPCGRYRIADCAISVFGVVNFVIEIQVSPISVQDLSDRIRDYQSMEIESLWFLGKKARSSDVLEFFEKYDTQVGILDFTYKTKTFGA